MGKNPQFAIDYLRKKEYKYASIFFLYNMLKDKT